MKFRLSSSFTKQSSSRSFEKPHDDHIACVCVCVRRTICTMYTCVLYNSLSLFHSTVHSTFLAPLLSLSLSTLLSFSFGLLSSIHNSSVCVRCMFIRNETHSNRIPFHQSRYISHSVNQQQQPLQLTIKHIVNDITHSKSTSQHDCINRKPKKSYCTMF